VDICADRKATCTEYTVAGAPSGTYCLLPGGKICAAGVDCETDACVNGRCAIANGEDCTAGTDTCVDANASCMEYTTSEAPAGTYCLLTGGETCARFIECANGFCINDRCAIDTSEACDTSLDACADQNATCTVYTTPGATADTFCLLATGESCTADDECVDDACVSGICAVATSNACITGADICADSVATCTVYTAGTPAGDYCLLPGGATCAVDAECETDACVSGRCAIANGEVCTVATDTCFDGAATCTQYMADGAPAGTYCLLPGGGTCAADGDCVSDGCADGLCEVLTTEACVAGIDTCADEVATCTVYTTPGATTDTFCLLPTGETCAADAECVDDACVSGVCAVATSNACTDGVDICADANAICTEYTVAGAPAGTYCLLDSDDVCTADAECETDACISGTCAVTTGEACTPGTSVCAEGNAECVSYSPSATLAPAGTFCLLPRTATCTTSYQCASDDCDTDTGACASIPVPISEPCSTTADICADSYATCTLYATPGMPAGTHCLFGGGDFCGGNDQCTGNVCAGGVCAYATGEACVSGVDSCADSYATCISYAASAQGAPSGTYCLLTPGDTCLANGNCTGNACISSICAVPTSETCTPGADTCANSNASCGAYSSGTPTGDYCLLAGGDTCTADDECASDACSNGRCEVDTGEACTAASDICVDANAVCTSYDATGAPTGTYCLLAGGEVCDATTDCISDTCTDGLCAVLTTEACVAGIDTCVESNAVCGPYTSGSPAGDYCLLQGGDACSANEACASGGCSAGRCTIDTGGICIAGTDTCANTGATCTTYDAPGAPSGTYCLLPGSGICLADTDCVSDACTGGRCEVLLTEACTAGTDTCADDGATCTTHYAGTPAGTYCLLDGGELCTADGECASDACTAGRCEVENAGICVAGSDTCVDASATCITYAVAGAPAGTYCVLDGGDACTADGECVSNDCTNGRCDVLTGSTCVAGTDTCVSSTATCVTYTSGSPSGTYCLQASGTCTANEQCTSGSCSSGRCTIDTAAVCTAGTDTCTSTNATCTTYTSGSPSGTYCLLATSQSCTANSQCTTNSCVSGTCVVPTVATGSACTVGVSVCTSSSAVCEAYSSTAAGAPAGTYCLLQTGAICTVDGHCDENKCTSGVCAAAGCTPNSWTFQSDTGDGTADSVYGVAITANGLNVFAGINATAAGGFAYPESVMLFQRTSTTSTTWTRATTFSAGGPCSGLRLSDDEQVIYVAINTTNKVNIFTRGASITNWTLSNTLSISGLSGPRGVGISSDQLTLAVIEQGANRVSIYSRPNALNTTPWTLQTTVGAGTAGSASNQFNSPRGGDLSPDGLTLYVADTNNDRISVWKRSTSTSTDWTNVAMVGSGGSTSTTFDQARGCTIADDNLSLYVANYSTSTTTGQNNVIIFKRPSTTSNTWTVYTTFGSSSQMFWLQNVALTPDQKIAAIADYGSPGKEVDVWSGVCV
jgi:hypothetical protein